MTLRVQVVSAEKEVWSGDAGIVVARTTDGEIGVLSGHQPTLAVLTEGEVRVGTGGIGSGGDALTAQIDGGFLSVENDTVLVVAERVVIGGGDASRSGGDRDRSGGGDGGRSGGGGADGSGAGDAARSGAGTTA